MLELADLYESLRPSRARLEESGDAIVHDQIAIAEIPSPTGKEERRSAWMARRLRRARLDSVSVDRAGNVVGLCRGRTDDAPVVVCAHLDTVFDGDAPIRVQRDQARLRAPGIGDNARGLAAMAALADEFSCHLRPIRPIVFAATTGEEGSGDLRGARYLFETVAREAHAAIAIDGAGDERIVACALGCRRYRVEFHGPGGHSWAAFGAPNAIHAAGGLVDRLTTARLSGKPLATMTVSRIGGGTAINAIPSEAWLEIDTRCTSALELARLDDLVQNAARDALDEENTRRRSGTSPLELRITPLSDRPAGELPDDALLVRQAVAATRCVGRVPEMGIASTDANIPVSLGIPAVAIGGGGRGGDTHTPHEWFDVTDSTRGVVRALLLLASMTGVA